MFAEDQLYIADLCSLQRRQYRKSSFNVFSSVSYNPEESLEVDIYQCTVPVYMVLAKHEFVCWRHFIINFFEFVPLSLLGC